MRKYAYIIVLALITGTLIFTSCRRMEQMMDPMMPDAEMIEPPEVGDANALLNYLTIEGATVVNAPLPETSIAQTAPRIQADVTEINASPGGIVSLPFAYSGTNALAGCIVCIEIEGVPGYFNLPYTGAPDDLPSAISVGLPPDVELGTFEVCYSVYDDQGQYSNYLRTVINVKEMPGEAPIEPVVEVVNIDRTDPNALPNRLTIEGATLVSASLPETSTAATAPRLQADISDINASPGGTIFLPFEYSGTNALAGCIVCIEGVPGYYDLPYTGAADALPTAIPVGLSINLELGTFEVCYSVYDDQGQYGNFLTAVINVEMEMPETTIDYTDPAMHLYLSFDELDGNQAIDHSQYQNHGMLVGNPQLVEGKFGKALEFNGQTDWVEVPHDESLLVETGLTIMAWIKTPRFTTPGTHWQGIIAKGNNPRSYSFYTQERSLHLSVGFGPQGSASDESLELNQWQHVVAQVDANGTHSYWINGKPAGSIPLKPELPGSSDTETILIGRTHESNREFLGLIDEVRLWRRVLSEEEILQQMGQGLHAE